MPYAFGTDEERVARAKCWQAFSPIIINSNDQATVAGGFLDEILDFTADQNYVILAAALSGSLFSNTAVDMSGVLAWTFDINALNSFAATRNLNNGSVVAGIGMGFPGNGGPAAGASGGSNSLYYDFTKYPIYFVKGQTITLGAFQQESGVLSYSASLFLLPTFA